MKNVMLAVSVVAVTLAALGLIAVAWFPAQANAAERFIGYIKSPDGGAWSTFNGRNLLPDGGFADIYGSVGPGGGTFGDLPCSSKLTVQCRGIDAYVQVGNYVKTPDGGVTAVAGTNIADPNSPILTAGNWLPTSSPAASGGLCAASILPLSHVADAGCWFYVRSGNEN